MLTDRFFYLLLSIYIHSVAIALQNESDIPDLDPKRDRDNKPVNQTWLRVHQHELGDGGDENTTRSHALQPTGKWGKRWAQREAQRNWQWNTKYWWEWEKRSLEEKGSVHHGKSPEQPELVALKLQGTSGSDDPALTFSLKLKTRAGISILNPDFLSLTKHLLPQYVLVLIVFTNFKD